MKINGGRPGASDAPDAVRQWLYKLTPDPKNYESFSDLLRATADVGNMEVSGDVIQDQAALAEFVGDALTQRQAPIIVGGGHETAYGHFLGYKIAGLSVEILNWDAHLDVRDLKEGQPHSGSPFWQAITNKDNPCRRYTVAGVLPHSCAVAHMRRIAQYGGRLFWRSELNYDVVDEIYNSLEEPAMVTFDMDAVDQAFAPGVSAPATGGMSSELWLYAAYQAGRTRAVRSIDIVEMNPKYDRDGQTARLAALTIWNFLMGICEGD